MCGVFQRRFVVFAAFDVGSKGAAVRKRLLADTVPPPVALAVKRYADALVVGSKIVYGEEYAAAQLLASGVFKVVHIGHGDELRQRAARSARA